MTLPTTPAAQLAGLAPAAVEIEIWSDIACPWCYIGKRRFARALSTFEHREHVRVVWRSYELQPDAPRSSERPGTTARDMLAGHLGVTPDAADGMHAQVTTVAAGEGLHYDFGSMVPANTFDAHRLAHIVAASGDGDRVDEVVEALMSAYFERGLAVDDPEVLVQIAVDAGLDGDAVRTALTAGDGTEEVRADEATARSLGANGVPFFVADRRVAVSGAQRTEVFTQLLTQAWEAAQPLVQLGDPAADSCDDDTCAI